MSISELITNDKLALNTNGYSFTVLLLIKVSFNFELASK